MSEQKSASMLKELRERTGVGMAKCKEALDQAKGDIEEAINILRKQGMASGVKKQGRETKEGTIAFFETPDVVAIAEINAETDFVAKNDRFQEFCRNVTEELAKTKPQSLESFLSQKYSKDPSVTIEGLRSLIIQVIGENIQIKRIHLIPKKQGRSVGIYSHLGGKLLSTVELEGANEEALAKDIAMHVAVQSPEYVKPESVPKEIIEKEREIAREQLKGKPANIMDKILDGKVNAYFDQVCLSRQKFIKDDTLSISDLIKNKAQSSGKKLDLLSFLRWSVGQG